MDGVPVLGIREWPGGQGVVITGGTAPDGRPDAVIHSYLTGDRRSAPAYVFAQTAGRDQTSAALANLLGRGGRPGPEAVRRLGEYPETAEIDGSPVEAVRHHWSDERIRGLEFTWRGWRVAVLAWERPLDAAFLASLGVRRRV
ncbi:MULTISPECIES: hypothetical protein [Kitasatospora]|uniref:Uncharacterized protein n=1 Tax=Kitasatospora cystarginea TaxID=58350 RepID=A0ABP5Q5P9_9ACTN